MKNLLLILIGGFIFGQDFDTQTFNSQFQTDLEVLQREIARQYTPKEVSFIGNRYYFKESQPAELELYDSDTPMRVITNYNLIEETFEIETDWKPLSISSDKVAKVKFKNNTFISLNGKFYELLYDSVKDFKLIADTYLKMEIGHYTPGIQEKPDPTFNKKNDYYIYYKERLIGMERSKGFISRMFGDNNVKKIKSVIKSNKIKPKNARQIGLLIEKYYEDLQI
tara:strand:- start:3874 stop:4545 length:672 start_codon:yes stop_codon:yes gene_type:complete